jgi:hypothetical protein
MLSDLQPLTCGTATPPYGSAELLARRAAMVRLAELTLSLEHAHKPDPADR